MADVDVVAVPVAGGTLRRLAEQEEWRSTCGMRRDLLGAAEEDPVRFHYLRIHDSRKHFHRESIEYYFIAEGEGEIELDDEVRPVKKGDLVVIPPHVRHTSRPAEGKELHALIVVVPPSGPDGRPDHRRPDEHYDE